MSSSSSSIYIYTFLPFTSHQPFGVLTRSSRALDWHRHSTMCGCTVWVYVSMCVCLHASQHIQRPNYYLATLPPPSCCAATGPRGNLCHDMNCLQYNSWARYVELGTMADRYRETCSKMLLCFSFFTQFTTIIVVVIPGILNGNEDPTDPMCT